MLPDTPFLQLVPLRLKSALERVSQSVWTHGCEVTIEFAGCGPRRRTLAEAKATPLQHLQLPFFWGRQFDTAWFRLSFPRPTDDNLCWLQWKEQGETTVYVDGEPWAGLDVAHFECRLPAGISEVWLEVACMESGIWKFGGRKALTDAGCRVEAGSLMQRDETAWKVMHDLMVLDDIIWNYYQQIATADEWAEAKNGPGWKLLLERVPVWYRRLLRKVDGAINALETSGLSAASEQLDAIYNEFRSASGEFEVCLTGHAHIDLVWLWPEAAGEIKAVHTFATANRLMDEYPELRFGYSQPASYEAVQRLEPGLMAHVKERIASGQWEALGASYVESDTLIACGEALARSFMIGQQGFRDLIGAPSPILWLPDVFGYAACLPQIMKQTGVDYFFTTKLTWGSVTKFPYSSFRWRGHDGSEVLAHVSQGLGYNCVVKASELQRAATEYRQSDVHNQTLMPCGYGDGGGGPTAEMCERARRFAVMASHPRSKWTRIDEFFDGLKAVQGQLPVYRGELYLQYHRGVLTTHGNLKHAFRRAERALQVLEAAHVAASRGRIDEHLWKRVVFAQFHDYIPGSSIQEVYDEALPELAEIAERAAGLAQACLSQSKGGEACVFNPLPVERRISIGDKWISLPALSGMPVSAAQLASRAVDVAELSLRNEACTVRFAATGRIAGMEAGDTAIAFSEPACRLWTYPDHPHAFEAWDIDRSTLSLGQVHALNFKDRGSRPDGSGWVAFEGALGDAGAVVVTYHLDPESCVLRVRFEVEWTRAERLLRVDFPTQYAGQNARYGAPFGSVLRSQHPGEARDESMWEVAGSRWASVSDDGELAGLAVISESKYGWNCRDGVLGLSLLRSALVTTTGIHDALRPAHVTHTHSDIGKHAIEIAIAPYSASGEPNLNPALLAESLFGEALSYQGSAFNSPFLGLAGGGSLVPTWAMPDSDGSWVLRLNETLGHRGCAQLQLAEGYIARHAHLVGEVGPLLESGRIPYTPYQLISIRIERISA